MKRETAKRLLDVQRACLEIQQFSQSGSADSILTDRSLQLVQHKLLEIVGEALNQLSKMDSDTATRIPNLRRYVDVRNQISHGYASVNSSIVWKIAQEQIPPLFSVVNELMQDAPPVKPR